MKHEESGFDLGCSTEETVKNIFKYNNQRKINFKYIGIDNSKQMIKLAKKKIKKKNIIFKTGEINNILFKKNSDLFISLLLFPFLKLDERQKLLHKIYAKVTYVFNFCYLKF